MGVSKFEFQPIESFQYGGGGYVVCTMRKQQARDTVLDHWSHTHVNWVLRKNLHSFGNTSIISDITQTDQYKLCVFTPSAVVTQINLYIFHLIIRIYQTKKP